MIYTDKNTKPLQIQSLYAILCFETGSHSVLPLANN